MSCRQLIRTLQCISSNPGRNRIYGFWRHLLWQVRKNWHRYPYEISVTKKSKIVITSQVAANGCAAMAWSMGRYDYDNMAFLQDLLLRSDEPKIFMDIGANIGIYSLLASEEPSTRVFAFEPHPSTSALLIQNIEANNRGNVTIERCALSSTNGNLGLTDTPGSPVNHLVKGSEQNTKNVVWIPTLRAEDYCHKNGIMPNFLKIDVEGHEAEVLQGLGTVLDSVKMLIIEEGLSQELIQTYLPVEKFSRFYVDFKTNTLRKVTNQRLQDPVFINNNYLSDLTSMGYRTEHPPQ
jgi:FkbM family methyltransferase